MKNRISTRDIMLDNLDDLFNGEKAESMYCDPPWGIGLIKYFRKLNGQTAEHDNWLSFLMRIKFLYERHVNGPLFIQIGLRLEKDLVQVFGEPSARYKCLYGSGKNKSPCALLCWGAVPSKSPEGLNNTPILTTVLESLLKKPKSVFDCCVGLGMAARACKKLGIVCYANELNPKRVAETMKILDFEAV